MQVAFSWQTRSDDRARELIAASGVGLADPKVERVFGSYIIWFIEGDPRVAPLLQALRDDGFSPTIAREIVYDSQEIQAAPLVFCWINSSSRVDFAADTEFDLGSGCAQCGCGAVQTSPLRVKGRLPSRRTVVMTYWDEILLHEAVVDGLRGVVDDPVDLRQVEKTRTHEKLPWWQVIPRLEMPPLNPSTRGLVRDRPCPACGRDGYYYDREVAFEPVWSEWDLRMIPADSVAWARSYERFGRSSLGDKPGMALHIAQPSIVVGSQVARRIQERWPDQLRFTPVTIKSLA